MTLLLLLTSSGGPKPVTAAVPVATTLTAVARLGTSRSASVTGSVGLTATATNGKEAVASVVQSSASFSAELRSKTKPVVAECNTFLTSSAALSEGTELASSIIASLVSVTASPTKRAGAQVSALASASVSSSAELRNGTELAASVVAASVSLLVSITKRTNVRTSARIDALANVTVRLPNREYGSPVSAGSGRTGNGGTPTPF